ncbi:hypothetical protein MNB_SM-5-68 [hydrothermal vent metagenome]|uniref:DUF3187 domain-containing protein n=1 Tax=hydrothermal vent metagenome TaxID=652676 RepID=A0A1W1BN56_9ZZZZ
MKKSIAILIASTLLASGLFAYSDADMDGVADSADQCPNTPFTDLVDLRGCTIKKVKLKQPIQWNADVILGINYSNSNFGSSNQADTYSTSLQTDFYYKKFSLQASTSYYKATGQNYNEKGFNDSFIGAGYSFNPLDNLFLHFGIGALLPTYNSSLNNNNTDYTASTSLSYTKGDINIFGGYSYTIINDDDVNTTNNNTYIYQNTNAYNIGLGYYFTNKLYMSGSYNLSNSIYKSINNGKIEDIKTASIYGYYTLNKNIFLIFSYARGLSDSASDNAFTLKAGYYF